MVDQKAQNVLRKGAIPIAEPVEDWFVTPKFLVKKGAG